MVPTWSRTPNSSSNGGGNSGSNGGGNGGSSNVSSSVNGSSSVNVSSVSGRTLRISPLLVLILLGLASSGVRLEAQLTGRVVLADEGSPVRYALVLLERGDQTVARTLTDERGAFSLAWSGEAGLSIRAERIGLGSVAVPLPTDENSHANLVLRLSPAPLEIDGIDVAAGARCPASADESGLAGAWAEFRGLLASLRSLDTSRDRQFEIILTEGLRDRSGDPDGDQQVDTAMMANPTPFVSAGADYLAEYGFVVMESPVSVMYYAPDANVLLSDEFLGSHCYRYPEQDRAGYTLIAFDPVDPMAERDVRGVFALPNDPELLPRIDFHFTSHPFGYPSTPLLGGFVEMAPTEIGWVVSEWELRVPNPPSVRMDGNLMVSGYYAYQGRLNRFLLGG